RRAAARARLAARALRRARVPRRPARRPAAARPVHARAAGRTAVGYAVEAGRVGDRHRSGQQDERGDARGPEQLAARHRLHRTPQDRLAPRIDVRGTGWRPFGWTVTPGWPGVTR